MVDFALRKVQKSHRGWKLQESQLQKRLPGVSGVVSAGVEMRDGKA